MRNEFNVDDRVVIRGFGVNNELENATGTVLGVTQDHPELSCYIVLLDNPVQGTKAVVLPGPCIYSYPEDNSDVIPTLYDTIDSMLCKLNEEQLRAKAFLNNNNFNCTTAPFVIVKQYRDALKKHIAVLRNNLYDE